ncbi:ribosomal protein S9, putative [Plasmodium knowlesi strain H]|uniref:Ribosomal protein S9, putative n=3 Tax=Plasmodium knowlesi TaxID=5850 RepID=A0A5K1TXB8_PLAKH|nr:ribosomal protein S9, mitochondrial, putative [Plasmodium knowlesi strain H]OTN65007.1 putative Ribosomal protein S9 [Plasmodium knowlesi]CAA9988396.1 ribosomal protein S9, mitochondrial, putative [Plasmodium knowlesi strain H]SBO19952.1 ribosomal protein S9, putative [Plasmodium knowlesi strain H]SBO20368.1 ribosomal protein S9, putative [Plasmodium knowlesi strain H]VVS77870.1 ribosomal protein S9, mitochondrial, putative [Plasmodium knowlesi strain H]|eukprot:XP_002259377.1 ribosomal protein s9, putative [Plasmodium knowlesi strain H]
MMAIRNMLRKIIIKHGKVANAVWVPKRFINMNPTGNEEKVTQERNKRDYILSLDEALYLSKEMGIKTTTEIQKIIMRSPPFSPDMSPFLIDNFLSSANKDRHSDEIDQIDLKLKELQERDSNPEESEQGEDEGAVENSKINISHDREENIINKILIDKFNKKRGKTFIHNDMEWLEESEGIGTNKRSCAYVYIKRGSGIVKVNDEEDLYIRWPYFYNRMDVLEPFYVTNTSCVFDVFIKLKGGGISGQSKAARLAIGRALLNACPLIYDDLQQHHILYEDMRQKFPKMPGRKKSRAMKQWSKR